MIRISLFVALALTLGCANTEYRFEQIDVDPPVVLPLKFDGWYGVRDGASVKAQGELSNGNDRVLLDIVLFLRPPAEFQSGTFQASVGDKVSTGTVECPSLDFQGGQTALPAVGGVFILQAQDGRPLYRIRIPATMLTGRPPR